MKKLFSVFKDLTVKAAVYLRMRTENSPKKKKSFEIRLDLQNSDTTLGIPYKFSMKFSFS